jgi:endoglucanase
MRVALHLATTACAALVAACGSSDDSLAQPPDDSGVHDGGSIDGGTTNGDATVTDSTTASDAHGDATPDGTAGPQGLHVEGNTLVDNGSVVQLRGVDHSGTEYTCVQNNGIFEGPTDSTLAAAMLTWHVNAVRIPLNEDCWLGLNGVNAQYSGTEYAGKLVSYVSMLRSQGLYVILDLHWNGPGTTLATGQLPMADADHALDFWTAVATAFSGMSGVIFDLYNEPYVDTSNAATSDPWDCWLHGCMIDAGGSISSSWRSTGMQNLVDAVRATGAKNVIMVGGLAYANDLSGWVAHKPTDPTGNLAASFHEYNFNTCSDMTCWMTDIQQVAAVVPVITGELGENDCAHGFIDMYMPWADSLGISYLGWTWNAWDCSSGPAMITGYDGAATAFGQGLKNHLADAGP